MNPKSVITRTIFLFVFNVMHLVDIYVVVIDNGMIGICDMLCCMRRGALLAFVC